jgi:hypothetical protein
MSCRSRSFAQETSWCEPPAAVLCGPRRITSQPRNRSFRSAVTRSRPGPQRTRSRFASRELIWSRPGPARMRSRPRTPSCRSNRSDPRPPTRRSFPGPPMRLSASLLAIRTSSPDSPCRVPPAFSPALTRSSPEPPPENTLAGETTRGDVVIVSPGAGVYSVDGRVSELDSLPIEGRLE